MLTNDVLTPEEAAEYLKLNVRTLNDYVRDGVIPARKIGRFWRLSRQCLDDWLDTADREVSHELRAAFDQARAEAAQGLSLDLEAYVARRPQPNGTRHVSRHLAETGGAAAR